MWNRCLFLMKLITMFGFSFFFFIKGCPDGTNPDQIRCLVDACTYEKCPRFPEADCVSVLFLQIFYEN